MKTYSLRYFVRLFGPKGSYQYVAEKLSPRYTRYLVRPKDTSLQLTLRRKTTDLSIFKQVWINQEYAFEMGCSPRTIIDAGANIGMSAAYFAWRYPTARIVAIECEKSNFDLLRINTEALPNVIPLHAALWHEDATIFLHDDMDREAAFTVSAAGGAERDRVQARSLASIGKEFGLGDIDLLKVDIEGAEKEVFENAAPWIKRVGTIAIELHDRMREGCARAFDEATKDFEDRTTRGENVIVSRHRERA